MITLHLHPLASFCWKTLIGLYETETPFVRNVVDLSDETQRAALKRLWPIGKFPVLQDGTRVVAESTTILEHLARFHPGGARLVPSDRDAADEARAKDRFFDLYVHEPMQKVVDDRIRPAGSRDALGVARARATLAIAYEMIERTMHERTWAAGDAFTIADCAAAPALYYANEVAPLGAEHPHTRAYLQRLKERPSVARVLAEAEPYMHAFPRAEL